MSELIAYLTRDEYLRIHAYCQAHDVDCGGPDDIYDAPNGGAINVWSRDSWTRRDGHLHCTYYCQRPDGKHGSEFLAKVMSRPEILADEADEVDIAMGMAKFGSTMLALETQGCRWLEIMYEPGFHQDDPRGRWGTDRDWTIPVAQEHLCAIYMKVVGEPLPGNRLISPSQGRRDYQS